MHLIEILLAFCESLLPLRFVDDLVGLFVAARPPVLPVLDVRLEVLLLLVEKIVDCLGALQIVLLVVHEAVVAVLNAPRLPFLQELGRLHDLVCEAEVVGLDLVHALLGVDFVQFRGLPGLLAAVRRFRWFRHF